MRTGRNTGRQFSFSFAENAEQSSSACTRLSKTAFYFVQSFGGASPANRAVIQSIAAIVLAWAARA